MRKRKVPIVYQMTPVECGAACLSMILQAYGVHATLQVCSERLGVGRDGASASRIQSVARDFGLATKAYAAGSEAAVRKLRLPAIVHWRSHHFVVLESVGMRTVTIVDPAGGRRRITWGEFMSGFSKVALEFGSAEDDASESRLPVSTTRGPRFANVGKVLAAPYVRRAALEVLVATLCLQALTIAVPLFTAVLVDRVLPIGQRHLVDVLGVGMAGLVLGQFSFGFLRARLLVYYQARLDIDMTSEFFAHLVSLPYSYFFLRTSGDLSERISSNAVIRQSISTQAIPALIDGALVVVYPMVLWAISPTFLLLGVCAGALQIAIILGTNARMGQLARQELIARAETTGHLYELLNGITALKASGSEYHAAARWLTLFRGSLRASTTRSYLATAVEQAQSTITRAVPLLVLWMGAHAFVRGDMTLGSVLAASALTAQFLMPLGNLVATGQQLQMLAAHIDRIGDVLDATAESGFGEDALRPTLTGKVEFRGVSFRYGPESPWVVRNISFNVDPGDKIAIVGPSGAGKSTIILLLLGLLEPIEGEVLFDGIPLRTLHRGHLRQQVGSVLQGSEVFSGTIRENLLLCDAALPHDRLVEAATIAGIHDEVQKFPMRYETFLMEGGAGLSGGQRQRLALARALVTRPSVLVLDEATSNLDTVLEAEICRRLDELGCTRIVVAHRLSTIRDATNLIVLEQGEMTQTGTHEELMQVAGCYAAMASPQEAERAAVCG